jgi:hypothetical protein
MSNSTHGGYILMKLNRKAKEIMAKNIIKEEEKKQKQKELRKNGQGDFSNAK